MVTWLFLFNLLVIVAIIGMYVGCESSERFTLGATIMVPLATFILGLDGLLELPADPIPLLSRYILAHVTNCLMAMLVSNLHYNKLTQRLPLRLVVFAFFLSIHAVIMIWAYLQWAQARSDDIDLVPMLKELLRYDDEVLTASRFGLYSGDGNEWKPMKPSDLMTQWLCTEDAGCRGSV